MRMESMVEISLRPFAPLPRNDVRWRGTKTVVCPTASLVCDSVLIFQSKCGFPEYTGHVSSPPKYYLRKNYSYAASFTTSNGHVSCSMNYSYDEVRTPPFCDNCAIENLSGGATFTSTVDGQPPGCTEVVSCTPRISGCGISWDGTDTRSGCTSPENNYSVPTNSCSFCDFWCGFTIEVLTATTRTRTCGSNPSFSHSLLYVETLSDEYTTDDLKANVVAALPAFDGNYDDNCFLGGVVNLASTETSYRLRRTRYKIVLSDPACAGMRVTWNYHTDYDDGAHSDTAGPGATCVAGQTEIGPFTIPDPSRNGTTTVTNIVIDCSECTE